MAAFVTRIFFSRNFFPKLKSAIARNPGAPTAALPGFPWAGMALCIWPSACHFYPCGHNWVYVAEHLPALLQFHFRVFESAAHSQIRLDDGARNERRCSGIAAGSVMRKRGLTFPERGAPPHLV